MKCERSEVVACEIFDSADAMAVLPVVDEQFAPRGNPECTERVTERFSEAGGVAGKKDWLGAWSEVVDTGDTGESERMMLVFVTRSCNAGTASAFEAHADRRPGKVQECVQVARLRPHERGQRRTVEHTVDVPVLQALEEIVEMVARATTDQGRRYPCRHRQTIQQTAQLQSIGSVVDISVEVPRWQFIDTVGDIPAVVQRQISSIRAAEIEALQFQVRAISCEIQEQTSGREEFLTKTNQLRMQRDECSQQIHAFREQISRILQQDSDADIADLERNNPKVSEYNKNGKDMEGFDPSLSSKHQWTNVSEQGGFLEKDKKGHSDVFAQLLSEHQNVSDDVKGFLDPRVEMKQEIQAKVAERQELFLNVANVTPHITEKICEQIVQVCTSLWRQCFFFFCAVVVCRFEEEERLFGHSCSECYLCWTDWDWLCD